MSQEPKNESKSINLGAIFALIAILMAATGFVIFFLQLFTGGPELPFPVLYLSYGSAIPFLIGQVMLRAKKKE
jgi:hypothetical protein